eukprot:gb/GECG01001189.1/.p1 GENE.gb/GECG01001189.1/~~gb/GECG01001189.1/.p1  ORF type:complete len:332 (+),score=10.28 gb/GECG01001189.1/:1-996(+)
MHRLHHSWPCRSAGKESQGAKCTGTYRRTFLVGSVAAICFLCLLATLHQAAIWRWRATAVVSVRTPARLSFEGPQRLNLPPLHSRRIEEQLGDVLRRNEQVAVDRETNFTNTRDSPLSPSTHGEPPRRILLHIGKCGGNVLKDTLGIGFFHRIIHISGGRTFIPSKNDHIFIAVRDPVSRLVSAWKWRKYLVWWGARMAETRCALCEETSCLSLFSSINELGEALDYSAQAKALLTEGCIRHVNQNFEYYVGRIIAYIAQNAQKVDLIRQEHLTEDVYTHFGKKVEGTTHYTGGVSSSSRLTEKARENLRVLLDSEYRIYYWLLELKNLRP